jgi:hypothetical protein
MCDCRKEIEGKLLERFKEQAPEAKGHSLTLKGYALIFGDTLKEKGFMELETEAEFPTKKGGIRKKKTRQNLIFTFCPFCGERYELKEAPPATDPAENVAH